MNIEIAKTGKSRLNQLDLDNLGFGQVFSDHMFLSEYRDGRWNSPRVVPFGNLELSPSTCSLHYGQAVFEGLKAFRTAGGGVNVFRPADYHARMNRSSARLCIPPVDYEFFMAGLTNLLAVDRGWVPAKQGYSLYIRPFIIATDNFLGVHVSKTYLFLIITSPVGAYYKEGMNPVRLMTSREYVRASRGGLGAAKTPANYAASLLPAEEAIRKGFTQVLYLDAIEQRYIEEVGTMNIMFVLQDELVTPPLGGTILGGITRATVLELARNWGIKVTERPITIDEVIAESKRGTLKEAFGTGTAAVISPVGWIQHDETLITVNRGETGPLSQRFYDEITGIQYGTRPDPFAWCAAL